jgi:luciferase family oxidoreductase group 1
MFPLSVLDLVPIRRGDTAGQALANALDLAQQVERFGYRRYWVAEHHNMVGIASAATSVVVGWLAGGTQTIRVGSGGIMLPNHSPLVIAEQFGTLASLYPGRIDLGLGRAPGTDQLTWRAMRRDPMAAEQFPEDVLELRELLGPLQPEQRIRAVPGYGTEVPLWILGSSLYGAQVAAHFGLPYAFASHFAPAALDQALAVYRQHFRPSAQLDRPWAMAAVNVVAADSDDEARHLFTSHQQRVTDMLRNARATLAPPIDDINQYWSPAERAHAQRMLECSIVGSPEAVAEGLQRFIDRTGADEVIVNGMIYDHGARVRSFEILAQAACAVEGPQRARADSPSRVAA